MYSYYNFREPDSAKTDARHDTIQIYSDDAPPVLRHRQNGHTSPETATSYQDTSKSYFTSTPEYVPRRLSFSSSDDSGVHSDLWSEMSSPLIELHSRWKRHNRSLYDTSVPESFMDVLKNILPVIIGVIVLSGAVYSVQLVMNGSRDREKVGGKYASILYAHKRIYNSSNPSRVPLGDIYDEDGNVLTGKRAALQFSHDRKHGKKNSADGPQNNPTNQSQANEVVEKEEPLNDPVMDKKKEIVKKVASFGHFASSKTNVKKRDLRQSMNEETKDSAGVKSSKSSDEEVESKKVVSLEPINLDELFNSSPQTKEVSKFVESKTPNKPWNRLIAKE